MHTFLELSYNRVNKYEDPIDNTVVTDYNWSIVYKIKTETDIVENTIVVGSKTGYYSGSYLATSAQLSQTPTEQEVKTLLLSLFSYPL